MMADFSLSETFMARILADTRDTTRSSGAPPLRAQTRRWGSRSRLTDDPVAAIGLDQEQLAPAAWPLPVAAGRVAWSLVDAVLDATEDLQDLIGATVRAEQVLGLLAG